MYWFCRQGLLCVSFQSAVSALQAKVALLDTSHVEHIDARLQVIVLAYERTTFPHFSDLLGLGVFGGNICPLLVCVTRAL